MGSTADQPWCAAPDAKSLPAAARVMGFRRAKTPPAECRPFPRAEWVPCMTQCLQQIAGDVRYNNTGRRSPRLHLHAQKQGYVLQAARHTAERHCLPCMPPKPGLCQHQLDGSPLLRCNRLSHPRQALHQVQFRQWCSPPRVSGISVALALATVRPTLNMRPGGTLGSKRVRKRMLVLRLDKLPSGFFSSSSMGYLTIRFWTSKVCSQAAHTAQRCNKSFRCCLRTETATGKRGALPLCKHDTICTKGAPQCRKV